MYMVEGQANRNRVVSQRYASLAAFILLVRIPFLVEEINLFTPSITSFMSITYCYDSGC